MLYNLALLLPSSVCFIYAVQSICKRKENSRSQNILAFCLLFTSISLFIFASRQSGVTDSPAHNVLDVLDAFISPLIFPLMFLYLRSLTSEKPFLRTGFLWLIPAIIIGSSTLVLNLLTGERHIATIDEFQYYINVLFYGWIVLGVVMINLYAVFTVFCCCRQAKNSASVSDDNSIGSCKTLLIWFLLSSLLDVVVVFTERTFWVEYPHVAILFFIVWATAYFGLGYCGGKVRCSAETSVQNLPQTDESVHVEEEERPIQAERYNKLLASFEKLMDEEQIYLKGDLRADEIARLMYTNRKYVTLIIKEEYHCSFSDYINSKRIEYSMELMRSNPELKQYQLAEQSGFQSASTFSKTFKQNIGVTPKEWYRNNMK